METTLRTALLVAGGLAGNASLCPLCDFGSLSAQPQVAPAAAPADTAILRLHISGMTCGSCPLTARLAIRELPGVYAATVTLDDSLGIVRYDPARVTPDQIAAHLKEMTGFTARVLPDRRLRDANPGVSDAP